MALVRTVRRGSDSESFQLAKFIVRVRIKAGAECAKMIYSMWVRTAQARVAPNKCRPQY